MNSYLPMKTKRRAYLLKEGGKSLDTDKFAPTALLVIL